MVYSGILRVRVWATHAMRDRSLHKRLQWLAANRMSRFSAFVAAALKAADAGHTHTPSLALTLAWRHPGPPASHHRGRPRHVTASLIWFSEQREAIWSLSRCVWLSACLSVCGDAWLWPPTEHELSDRRRELRPLMSVTWFLLRLHLLAAFLVISQTLITGTLITSSWVRQETKDWHLRLWKQKQLGSK